MARKRFNADERALLALLQEGSAIEWQNVTQWHPAEITSPVIRTDDGWQYVEARNLATTARMSPGPVRVTPGHIREAATRFENGGR